jgi:hypothetical protein
MEELSYDEVNNLHQIFINLFNKFNSNNFINDYEKNGESRICEIGQIDNPIIFNYNFDKEIDYGFIEYKRTLIYYNNKKSKLLRQIYWRMSEFSVAQQYNKIDKIYKNYQKLNSNINHDLCYYIIGLENSGIYSNINTNELYNSLDIIKKTIYNTNINCNYIFLFNKEYNAHILLVELYVKNIKYLNYLS